MWHIGLSSQVAINRIRDGLRLWQGTFILNIWENFFTKSIFLPWQRLSRAAMKSPSLKGFKRLVDVALGGMVSGGLGSAGGIVGLNKPRGIS